MIKEGENPENHVKTLYEMFSFNPNASQEIIQMIYDEVKDFDKAFQQCSEIYGQQEDLGKEDILQKAMDVQDD